MYNIEVFPLGPAATNAILLWCPKSLEAAIIDAPLGVVEVIKPVIAKKKLQIAMIILTHSHWDHIAEAALLKRTCNAPLYIHEKDAPNVEKPGADGLPLPFPIDGVKPDHTLKESEKLLLGELDIEIIHTPGHSPGGVCLYLPKEKLLISGDTLFQAGMGRVDLPTSHPNLMISSLKKLGRLPADTRVIPGHGDETTIGDEKEILCY